MAAAKFPDEFKVGDKFINLPAFKEKLCRYRDANYENFYIRDMKTLKSAMKRGYKVASKESKIVYYYVKYCCSYGVRFKNSKDSNRPSRGGCPAYIYLKATNDGKFLEIRKLDTTHNHEVSEEMFRRLPKQHQQPRRNCLVNTDAAKATSEGNNSNNNVQIEIAPTLPIPVIKLDGVPSTIADSLQAKYKATVRVSTDKVGHLQGLFIQDDLMREDFSAYPDLMYADVAHTLLDVKQPVYTLMIEDANGQYLVVALGLLVGYDQSLTSTLDWFLETFKELNAKWTRTRVIMMDKDMMTRSVFKRHFPSVSFLTCLLHSIRAFKRDVSSTRTALDTFHRMAVAKDLEDYNENYDELHYSASESVFKNFSQQWDDCRDEWAMGLNFGSVNSLVQMCPSSSSGQMQFFLRKLKAFAPIWAPSLQSFVDKLFRLLVCMRRDRVVKTLDMLDQNSASVCPVASLGSPEELYWIYLTPHASEMVRKEMRATLQVKEMQQLSATDFMLTTSEGSRKVTSTSCDCPFNGIMKLPCRHVFEIRKILGLDSYETKLCGARWLRSRYRLNCQLWIDDWRTVVSESNLRKPLANGSSASEFPMTTEEKFQKASLVLTDIAHLMSNREDNDFQEKLQFFQDLLQLWSNEKDA